MVKYLICPGFVYSQHDDQKHFISAGRLIELYNVDPAECCIDEFTKQRNDIDHLIRLTPKYHGDYTQ